MEEIKVVLYGLGSIGQCIAKTILEKKGVVIVGAIDIDPAKVGKDLGEILGLDRKLGVTVMDNPDELLAKIKADVAIVATTSYARTVYDQVVRCIKAGMHVITTSEEMAYPWVNEPQLASEIDGLAREHGVTVLGTA